jgi:hypothetical protein
MSAFRFALWLCLTALIAVPMITGLRTGKWRDFTRKKQPILFWINAALGGVDTYRIHKTMAARVTTAR